MVETDKIGSGVYFWSLPSKSGQQARTCHDHEMHLGSPSLIFSPQLRVSATSLETQLEEQTGRLERLKRAKLAAGEGREDTVGCGTNAEHARRIRRAS